MLVTERVTDVYNGSDVEGGGDGDGGVEAVVMMTIVRRW